MDMLAFQKTFNVLYEIELLPQSVPTPIRIELLPHKLGNHFDRLAIQK